MENFSPRSLPYFGIASILAALAGGALAFNYYSSAYANGPTGERGFGIVLSAAISY
jgi:hypothetical protein